MGIDLLYDWRYIYNEEVFKVGLSKYFREKFRIVIKDFMKYSIILDKVWVILEWIDENIEYEYIKVDYVDVFVYNWLKLILE